MKLTKEIKIALFTLFTVVAFFFTVNYLKGKEFMGGNSTYYTTRYEIEGLVPTTPIYLRGLKIGSIQKIEYNANDDLFFLTLRIKSTFTFPEDSKAVSYDTDLLGTRAIKIELGESQTSLQNRGNLISANEEGAIEKVIASFIPIAEEAETLLASLNELSESIGSTLTEQLKERLHSTVEQLEKTVTEGSKMVGALAHHTPSIEESIKSVEVITKNLESGSATLNETLESISLIGDSLANSDLAGTIESVKSLLEKIENPEGTIGKILSEDELHNSTVSLINELQTLIEKISENPKKYFKISIF